MNKPKPQVDKRKREIQKRKQTENLVKKLAAALPEPGGPPEAAGRTKAPEDAEAPGVPCLRCEGTGRVTRDCSACGQRGVVAVRCRKCAGLGTYTQEAGPCARCGAKGVLADGTTCPRCKGRKTQMAFTAPCAQCTGTGTFDAPCKRCGGSLHVHTTCGNCNGTGRYTRKQG